MTGNFPAHMSNEDEQIAQRRANLAAITELGVQPYPHKFATTDTVSELVARHGDQTKEELEVDPCRNGHSRADHQYSELREGRFFRPLGWPQPHSGLCPAGCIVGARLRRVATARLRRLHRRRGPSLPHQDQRAVDLGVAAGVSCEVLRSAARKVARSPGRRDPLPSALPRSRGQSRRAPGVRDSQPHRDRACASF